MDHKGGEASVEPADSLQLQPQHTNGSSPTLTASLSDSKEISSSRNGLDSKPRSSTSRKTSTSTDNRILGTAKAEHRYKMWLKGELVGLGVVIVIVWGLFLLPIVFYHLPVESSNDSIPVPVGEMCSSVVTYDGSVCREELNSFRGCLPNAEQDNVLRVQSDQSDRVSPLLSGLNLIASEECKAAALPFLCVHFFGLCDSTGRAYRPSSSQCTEISTGVCAREWALAGNLPGVMLPDCALFPDETILIPESCDNETGSSGDTPTDMPPPTELLNQSLVCTCREDFYCKNGSSLCFPECGLWKQYSDTVSNVIDGVVILAVVIGIVSSVAVFIIAGMRWKKVYTFPSMFVIYETVSLLTMAIFVLVTYFDRTGLYCSSRDLQESILTAAPFCVISGMLFYYILIQLAVWWVVHVTALFWKIRFPFHARRFESARRVRYVHIIAVIVGLLLPLLPVIVAIADDAVDSKSSTAPRAGSLGFSLTRFPPILCTGIDRNATYYSLAFPLNLILIVGMTELILIFWIIHKQHGLFKVKQSKNPFKIGTAERKILIVFCYYVIVAIISLVAFTISTRDGELFSNKVLKYFLCEQSNPSEPCSREGFQSLNNPALTSMSYILLGLFPLINLTYVINFQEFKEKMNQCLTRLHLRKEQQREPITSVVSDGGSTIAIVQSGRYT